MQYLFTAILDLIILKQAQEICAREAKVEKSVAAKCQHMEGFQPMEVLPTNGRITFHYLEGAIFLLTNCRSPVQPS